jgi:ABC-type sugar transport system ATPase subunit
MSKTAYLTLNGAGKSTLINIIAGNYQPDDGFIETKGDRVAIKNNAEALNLGISFVYQETRKK